jgi:hypothetical protein
MTLDEVQSLLEAPSPATLLSVFDAVPPFRGVKVSATAELRRGAVAEARLAMATRYLRPERGRRFASRGPGVVVRLPADRARVWDLSRILP